MWCARLAPAAGLTGSARSPQFLGTWKNIPDDYEVLETHKDLSAACASLETVASVLERNQVSIIVKRKNEKNRTVRSAAEPLDSIPCGGTSRETIMRAPAGYSLLLAQDDDGDVSSLRTHLSGRGRYGTAAPASSPTNIACTTTSERARPLSYLARRSFTAARRPPWR